MLMVINKETDNLFILSEKEMRKMMFEMAKHVVKEIETDQMVSQYLIDADIFNLIFSTNDSYDRLDRISNNIIGTMMETMSSEIRKIV